MKKVLILLLLLVVIVLPAAAQAGSKIDVEGYFTYVPLGCEVDRWANDVHILRNCRDVGDYFAGDFLGTSTEVYDFVMHGADPDVPFDYEYGWYKGTTTFTGTVAGRQGTMVLMLVGTSPGDLFTWSGTWRILRGTGELANIRGQGVWGNIEDPEYPGVHYEGQIHFDP